MKPLILNRTVLEFLQTRPSETLKSLEEVNVGKFSVVVLVEMLDLVSCFWYENAPF